MAFYKSKYTGTEIDQRLAQATYDDAVLAGFEGSKEEFDAILGKLKEIADKAENSIQMESENLETFNKNIVDAINELHRELQAKPDEQDVIDQGELEVFKDEIAAKYVTREEVEGNIQDTNSKISTLNNNLVESINTINKNVNDSLAVVNQAIQQNAETLVAEIEQRKEADKEIGNALNNDPNFAATMTNELSKKLDSDKLLSGAGINIREEDGKKIVDVADDTLTKIQYSDSEVRRLEKDKIPYAYDEKTQSNINVILPEGGSYLGNYGDENATVAKAAVYDGTKQLELGSSKVHTNINTDSDVTIETSDGKKVIATIDQIPNVFETKGLTELETGESGANIEAALGIDFVSLIEIIRENKTIIMDRNSIGDYKTCVHASGNISSDNGAANLMFFIGTTPTIYQVQYVNGTFALAVDEYPFAKKSDIPDVSNLATRDELPSLDGYATETWVNEQGFLESIPDEYITETKLEAKNYATKSELPNMSGYVTTAELETKVDKVEGKQLSTEDYTTEEKEKLSKVNPELISAAVNFPIRTSGGSDGPEKRVYTQEEILDWFGVKDVTSLKNQIAKGGIQYIKYGISLSGNPYYYKMPVEYCAFESANQIKLVFIGLNTRNDTVSKYEILANLDGTLITENSNVKMTIINLESKEIDLSGYVTKDEFNTMKTSLESQINNLNTTISQLQLLIRDTNAD